MALSPVTPRDRLQGLVDLGRKAFAYWWLVAIFTVVGGGLSLAYAITRGRAYQSYATLQYDDVAQASVVQNRIEVGVRNVGDRLRELLFARPQLLPIINDPKLSPFPAGTEQEAAVEKLRAAIRFDPKGANNFRITYSDSDPERARDITDRLVKLLREKDNAQRKKQAESAANFATTQQEQAAAVLHTREQALAEFQAKHPEFAADPNQQSEGASIRAFHNQKPVATGNARLYALERQRQRIQSALDAPPDAKPVRIVAPPTPERVIAEQAVAEAQRELSAANRELEEATGKYTEKHPTVIKAQEHVAEVQQRLRHAQAAVPPAEVEPQIAATTPADRTKLQKELATLDGQIADEQKRSSSSPDAAAANAAAEASTNWVVNLETEYSDLHRQVTEQRDRVAALSNSVFVADMDAQQRGGGVDTQENTVLTVVDSAFVPAQPSGPGKTIFLIAGVALFLAIGAALAIGLAVIDDRLNRRADIDQLGIAVLAVIPPAHLRKHRA